MNRLRPRISIGLPVYNGGHHLRQTIECLLGQDLADFELIITDNASSDATEETCNEFARRDHRIRYSRSPRNLGAAANFNRAFNLARAPLFKWAPHDDLYAPSFLHRCVEELEAAPGDVVVCYPKTLLIDEHGEALRKYEDELDLQDPTPAGRLGRLLSLQSTWCHPAVGVMRRDVLASTRLIGNFAGSDHVLLAEMALRGCFRELPERLFYRRVQAGESPSLRANASPEERAAWFDSRNTGVALPRARLLYEHIRAIHRAPLSRVEKRRCYRLLRTSPFADYWSRDLLAEECRRALRLATWERHVVGGAARAERHYLPHRAWALFSGLKRCDWGRMLLAASPPSASVHAALLDFVAECFSQRSDRRSREYLEQWISGRSEARRMAAARALGQRGTQAPEGAAWSETREVVDGCR